MILEGELQLNFRAVAFPGTGMVWFSIPSKKYVREMDNLSRNRVTLKNVNSFPILVGRPVDHVQNCPTV